MTDFIRRNPVVVIDLLKYLLACLIVFGVPIPPGLDVALAGVVVALLSLYTRSRVTPVGTAEDGYTPRHAAP